MGIVSSIINLGGYAKRAAKVYTTVTFGKGAEAGVNAAMKAPLKDSFKAAGKAIEAQRAKEIASRLARKQGPIAAFGKSLKDIPRALSVYTKKGIHDAAKNGSSFLGKALGGTKGFFKGVGSRMPFLGNILLVAFALPNILTATKEQGIGSGVKETVKTAARLAGAAVGGAIGTVLCPIPFVGSLLGFGIGDWLTSKVVGKDYVVQKAEAEEQMEAQMEMFKQLQQQQVPAEYGFNPTSQIPHTGNPYMGTPNPMMNPMAGNPFMNPYMSYNSNPYENDMMMRTVDFNV